MSIFSISISLANAIYDLANVVLIVGAALVFLGTIAVVWTGGIKERAAELRISANEVEAAHAKENAASAIARAESFHAEAEQARLATEHLKQELAWRVLTHTQMDAIARALIGSHFTVMVEHTADPEAAVYAAAVEVALRHAGLDVQKSQFIDQIPAFGLVISGKTDDAETLLRAFASAKVEASRGAKLGKTIVLIGSRQPFFGDDTSPGK